jgi:periplasmic copper chaperone A
MWSSMGMSRTAIACVMAMSALFAASIAKADDLKVENAWVQFVPNAKTLAAYFTLTNAGEARQLIGAECAGFEKTELHVTRVNNGVATMETVAQLDVPTKGKVSFAPGGLHVMLIGPKAALAEGGNVDVTLVFNDGTKLPMTAVLKKGAKGHAH